MLSIKNIFLIALSAILYTLSFMVPPLWWTILLFTGTLLQIPLRFSHGFLWGIVAWGIHGSPVLYAAMRMQNGPWIFRIIPSLLIIIYLALHAGVWFCLIEKVKVFNKNILLYSCATATIHALFFWYISYGCFWPFVCWQGYPFLNPLLPLVQAPVCLKMIELAGIAYSLFALFLGATLMYYFSKKSAPLLYMIVIICLHIPLPIEKQVPDWIKLIAPFQIQFSSTKNSIVPLEYLNNFIKEHPNKKIFITPESAFYCHQIFDTTLMPTLGGHDVICIIGSFMHTQNRRYNTLYYIKSGIIQGTHHKQHALALTESLPSWCTAWWIERLHDKKTFITAAANKHDVWILKNHLIEPYTCSEFFCQAIPLHPLHVKSTLLICCNDSWFTGLSKVVSRWMVADARLKAVAWSRDIIYLGYQDALFITKRGGSYSLS